ncbi:hypothetical protein [Emticicia sp. SJ17W-69]|uniref:hypothetical protein n=1 Tax=Emticicia sp. SJ17W-69 TaxID=3421657 RepID=UPI003EBA674E
MSYTIKPKVNATIDAQTEAPLAGGRTTNTCNETKVQLKQAMAGYIASLICADINLLKDNDGKVSAEKVALFLPKLESALNTIGSYQLPKNTQEVINAIVNGDITQCNYGNAAELLADTYEDDILIKDYNEKTKTSVVVNDGIVCMLRKITDEEWLKNYKKSLLYQTDGHFGTVYLIGLMLGLTNAKEIAKWTEFPDNIINEQTQKAELRTTWGNPDFQGAIHALTNGFHGEEEFVTLVPSESPEGT